ncbi:hypothetical protein MA16_Dca021011 [Dendrobium catenatum]|uniref:Uncharacterized protein n=1 Tax=Dendrobium catenatum TaxID=906689 RepID=A0A2I0X5V2_9ASPA|nr:hypothetical protein MA16_Dca021011 [Dendrobium catenatum]
MVEFEGGRRSLEGVSSKCGGGLTRLLRQACTLVPSDSRLVLREVLGRRRSLWCQRTRLLRHTEEGGSDFKIQLAGQLIFSFDLELSSTVNDQGSTIIFGMGFSTLELSMDGHQIVSLDASKEVPPVVELIVGSAPTLPVISDDQKQPEPVVEPPTEIKSVFEKGSSSGLNFSTKNQKKNYLRRLRKKISKAKRVVSVKTLAQVEPEADEELPIPASSPLLKGSRFYPLAYAQGEERIARIARSPPCPVDYSAKKTPKEKYLHKTRALRNIFHTCAAQSGQTKEQYMKQLKGVISHRFQKEVLKEEASEEKNLTPQPVRRNKKYIRQPATSVLVDGYHWAPRPPSSKTEGIVLTGSEIGYHSVGRPPVPPSKTVRLASVVVKPKGNETLKHLDIKGKRPKSPKKKFVPKRTKLANLSPPPRTPKFILQLQRVPARPTPVLIESMDVQPSAPVVVVDSSLATSPVTDSVMIPVDDPVVDSTDLFVIPRLPTQESEDLTLPDVGAISLQAPASPLEIYVPLLVENATSPTTDHGTVEKEGIDLDLEIEEDPVTESQLDPNPKLTEIIALLDSEELFDMTEYKRYLPLDPKSIRDRPVEEVVQEIRNILLNKEGMASFDPDLDDLLREEDDYVGSVSMVETRGSNKEVEPGRRRLARDDDP